MVLRVTSRHPVVCAVAQITASGNINYMKTVEAIAYLGPEKNVRHPEHEEPVLKTLRIWARKSGIYAFLGINTWQILVHLPSEKIPLILDANS